MSILFHIVIPFVVSILAAIWIYPKMLHIALSKNIVDNPDARKLQRVPIPVLGGMAIMFGILVSLSVCQLLYDCSDLFTIVLAMSVMLYVGTIDDIVDLSPTVRFLIEIAVALMLMYTCGYSIDNFHGLWGLHEVPLYVSLPLTVVTVVGLINAVNLIDGVDGYSSGYSIMACTIFGVLFAFVGDVTMVMLACTCAASLIPFFLHNVFGKTSKMFIGDGGTLVMGTVMGIFVLNMSTVPSVEHGINNTSAFNSLHNIRASVVFPLPPLPHIYILFKFFSLQMFIIYCTNWSIFIIITLSF